MLEKRNFPAQIECVVGGELNVGGKLVIGQKSVTDSLVISKGGFFNGNVTKIKDRERKPEAQKGLRPVYLVEEKRLEQQK